MQADIPKDVYLPKALANPAPFLFPIGFCGFFNTPNPAGDAALKHIKGQLLTAKTASKSQKFNQIDYLRMTGGRIQLYI